MTELGKDIIDQCRKGERRAQMQLYTAFSRRIYNSCYRILGNSADAEDTAQESFLKVFTNLHNYDDFVSLTAWITRIAINASIDRLRKKELDIIEISENISYDILDDDDDENWEYTLGQVDQIKSAIGKLPETGRLIITLYLIEGYDHEEIAEILNIKAATSRIQYMRAKQKLIELLKTA